MPVELYVGTDGVRAAALGLTNWVTAVPTAYPTAVAPCVILDSQFAPSGPVILEEPTDIGTVQAAASVMLAAEAAAAASAAAGQATQYANASALVARAQTALGNNASYLANPSLTQAQAVQQVSALTRQVNALIRINLQLFTDTSDT